MTGFVLILPLRQSNTMGDYCSSGIQHSLGRISGLHNEINTPRPTSSWTDATGLPSCSISMSWAITSVALLQVDIQGHLQCIAVPAGGDPRDTFNALQSLLVAILGTPSIYCSPSCWGSQGNLQCITVPPGGDPRNTFNVLQSLLAGIGSNNSAEFSEAGLRKRLQLQRSEFCSASMVQSTHVPSNISKMAGIEELWV